MIYLDYASHTPACEAVLDEFCKTERNFLANPTSAHRAGLAARAEFNRNRSELAEILGVQPEEVIFTSGATEANNLAVKGITQAYRHTGKHILSTCLEHPSVSAALTALQDVGYEVDLVSIQNNGMLDLEHMESLLRPDTVLACVCMTDSELGAIQPITAIAELIKRYPNCHLHVDAAQAVGKLPFSFDGVDTLSFTPHKFHGLCGCGVLLKREGVQLQPLIHGGVSTTPYLSGTPALALAAACTKALEIAVLNQPKRFLAVEEIHRYTINELARYPKVRVNSPKGASPYILNVSVQGVKGQIFQQKLDEHGVCVSVKSACSVPGTPSRPVLAISKDKKNAQCSWRISFSHCTNMETIKLFISAFDKTYKELTF